MSILHQSLPFQKVVRTHVANVGAQRALIDMPWFDLGMVRVGELVASETLRRWANGGRKRLAGTSTSLLPRADQFDVLLSRHSAWLQKLSAPVSDAAHVTAIGLTTLLQRALVLQGWDGDEASFDLWMKSHRPTGSGWQAPEQHAMALWNQRRAELQGSPVRRTEPRRATLRSWWRGERWIDIHYDPPLELDARDGGPPAAAPRGTPPRHTLTLSKAQARPYRGEAWLNDLAAPEVNEAALSTWWLRPISALGEAGSDWQPGAQARRQAGGTQAQPVRLRIAAAVDVLPSLRKSALRARRVQRVAKRVILVGIIIGIASPLWVPWAAVIVALVQGVR
ncbi:MAG: hypothetical protein RLZZ618_797 [Pseudomonadota bacterium]